MMRHDDNTAIRTMLLIPDQLNLVFEPFHICGVLRIMVVNCPVGDAPEVLHLALDGGACFGGDPRMQCAPQDRDIWVLFEVGSCSVEDCESSVQNGFFFKGLDKAEALFSGNAEKLVVTEY